MTTPASPDEHVDGPAGRVPLYRTIADGVIRDIRRGRFQEGSRLPASRALARTHEVNRATVHQALQVLKREGWIETNKGGGTRVARRSLAGPMVGPAPSWDRIASTLLARILAEAGAQEGPPSLPHDLARLAPDEREFPAEAFAKVLAEVARDGALLAYGSPFGYRPLRETLAARLERRGVPAEADSLLIVNGAQQGLDLITRALVDPGDAVGVESPSYSGALSLLRAHGARLLGVPLDAEGPEPGALRAALAERPKFLYTIPDFQNPTGLLATAARRRDLVGAAAAAGVRVGWISGPREFVHRLAALKRIGELTSPPVLQAALNVFLSRGEYDRHLLRVKARLKARLALAQRTVLRSFPVGTRCERPLGGWVLWVELPAGISGRELAEAARGAGVLVSPGGDYAPDRADVPSLRISVARSSGAELEKALESLGVLARAAVRRAHRRAPRAEERREEALIQI